jgi:adenylate cyclase
MPRDRATLAILFADIAQSTQLYETLGNSVSQAIINRCLNVLITIAKRYEGTLVKTIGDEIMCTFPTADQAVKAGQEMNQSLETLVFEEKPELIAPNIHTGIQYGSVILENGDVFGEAVNVAARLVDLAKQREIVTTAATIETLSPDLRMQARHIDTTTVKGKSGELDIYEIIWELEDVTVMLDDTVGLPSCKCHIQLRLRDVVLQVDENRPSASLGRQPHNDMVVENNRVSRSHARVEYRRGKFVLIDQSTNGTFIAAPGKRAVQIKRDEFPLIGSGVIGLGRKMGADTPDAIHFTVRT